MKEPSTFGDSLISYDILIVLFFRNTLKARVGHALIHWQWTHWAILNGLVLRYVSIVKYGLVCKRTMIILTASNFFTLAMGEIEQDRKLTSLFRTLRNRRDLKMPASRFRVDGKHYFWKR